MEMRKFKWAHSKIQGLGKKVKPEQISKNEWLGRQEKDNAG